MQTTDCIMLPGDIILKQTVREFTEQQWESFRNYLKSFGYRILDGYGKCIVDFETTTMRDMKGVVLYSDDLVWTPYTESGKIIDKQTILTAIGLSDQIQNQSELKQIEDKIATLKAELDTLEKQYVEVKTKKHQTQLTTAIAIQLIGKAMSQPYTAIKFKDYNDNKLSIDEICERIKESIEKLGINGIYIGDMSQMLYYRPED